MTRVNLLILLVLKIEQNSKDVQAEPQSQNIAYQFNDTKPRWLSWICIRLVIRKLQVRPPTGQQHSFMKIDREIFSTVILSILLIQEGQLSVSGERMVHNTS